MGFNHAKCAVEDLLSSFSRSFSSFLFPSFVTVRLVAPGVSLCFLGIVILWCVVDVDDLPRSCSLRAVLEASSLRGLFNLIYIRRGRACMSRP